MNQKEYKSAFFWTAALLVLILLGLNEYEKDGYAYREVPKNAITSIRGTIAEKPKIVDIDESKSLLVHLKEFPGVNFTLNSVNYPALKERAFFNDVSAADTVLADILKYDYETKITMTKSMHLFESMDNNIPLYGLRRNNQTYLTREDVNKAWRNEHELGFWMVLSLTIPIGILVVLKLTGSLGRFKNWIHQLQADQ